MRFALALGIAGALGSVGACSLDESGSENDGGVQPDVTSDVLVAKDASTDATATDAIEDVSYDVPDLGTGETEAGVPCTCVVPPPQGYTFVEYDPTTQPNCDPQYGNHTDWMEVPSWSPASCSCVCTPPTGVMCSCGNTVSFAISSGNGNCTDNTNESLSANLGPPGCDTNNQTLNPGNGGVNNMQAALPTQTTCAPQNGTCGPPMKTQTLPPYVTENGRMCPLQGATSACNGSNVCVPTPANSSYALCVTNMTTQACPGAFPVTHLVGNSVQDSRTCGPSSCSPGSCGIVDAGTCGTPQLVLSPNDNNCGGQTVTLPADGTTCVQTSFGNGVMIHSARYTVAQSGGACGLTSPFAPEGQVAVNGGYNICCHP